MILLKLKNTVQRIINLLKTVKITNLDEENRMDSFIQDEIVYE
jgi:hypothetical protein